MRHRVPTLLTCVVLAACTSNHDSAGRTPSPTPAPTTTSSPATFSVPTNRYEPGMAWPTAALSGTLRVAAQGGATCFFVDAGGGRRVSVSWPKGFRGDSTHARARLLAPDGSIVAQVGDHLTAGGGVARTLPSCNVSSSAFAAGPIDVDGRPVYGPRRR